MKNTKSISKYLLPLAFIAMLCLPVFNSLTQIWTYERADENRGFKDSLHIDIKKLDPFPKECEAYVNDNFSFRKPMLDVYHHVKFSSLKVSPHPDQTIVGSDNWFFMAGKEKSIYEGNLDFSEKALGHFLSEWTRRKSYLDSLDIKLYWIIAPMKHSVYPEHIPFHVYQSPKRRVTKLKEHLQKTLPDFIIDPVPEMLRSKDSLKLFFQLDNHWNYEAGRLVARILLSKMREDFPDAQIASPRTYTWTDSTTHWGIHHKVMGIEALHEVSQYPDDGGISFEEAPKYGFPCVKGFPFPWEYEIRFVEKELKSGLKVLFIRDSFGQQVMPFVRNSFAESVYIFDSWKYRLNKKIIEQLKPDAVVFLGLETHLEAVISDYPDEGKR